MNKNFTQIEILLSTYNGGKYLREQLDSLLAQTCNDWVLLARDDGSSDDTVIILEEYHTRHPEKIRMVSNGKKRLGACASFASLLAQSTARYVMFCDQDDVWLPEKVAVTLECMLSAESKRPGLPVLVHTDMYVTDNVMSVIAESFWRYQNLDPRYKSLKELLILNNVTGCTLMANRLLVDVALPVPAEAIIHDWWLTLVAEGIGVVEHLDRPLLKYRQHGTNELGAVNFLSATSCEEFGILGSLQGFYAESLSRQECFIPPIVKGLQRRTVNLPGNFLQYLDEEGLCGSSCYPGLDSGAPGFSGASGYLSFSC